MIVSKKSDSVVKKELKTFINTAREFFSLVFSIFNLGQHLEDQIFAQFSKISFCEST